MTACSGTDSEDATTATAESSEATPPPPTTMPPSTSTTARPLTPADAETIDAITAQLGASASGCDALDTRSCVLPFPSGALSADDSSSQTGRRVAFPEQGLPTNSSGVPIDPTAWNRHDGFSPNTPLLTWFDDLDPIASALPTWTDLESSLDDDATVALVDVATGERIALWAEPDVDSTRRDRCARRRRHR